MANQEISEVTNGLEELAQRAENGLLSETLRDEVATVIQRASKDFKILYGEFRDQLARNDLLNQRDLRSVSQGALELGKILSRLPPLAYGYLRLLGQVVSRNLNQ